jgi:apolipoprotein D and lipocalin family protein
MSSLSQILLMFPLAFALQTTAVASETKKPIPTVERVDLESYLGLWYENRRIENDFQDNEPSPGEGPCFNTTAEYTALPKGKIEVKNTCGRQSGREVAKATARVVRGSKNAKLKVNFTGIPLLEKLGIGDGDYWVLALGEKNANGLYSWALVGAPKLDFGWILSRTPDLEESEVQIALNVAESLGYDPELFKSFNK